MARSRPRRFSLIKKLKELDFYKINSKTSNFFDKLIKGEEIIYLNYNIISQNQSGIARGESPR